MAALAELNLAHENPPIDFRSTQEARTAYPVIEKIEEVFEGQLTTEVRYNRYRREESTEE